MCALYLHLVARRGKKKHAWNLKFSPKCTHYMWHALVSFLNRMITLIHNFRMPGGSNIWQHYFGKSRWKCRVDITKTSSITPDIKYTEYTEFYSVLQNTQSLVCYLYLLNQRGIWETNKPKKKHQSSTILVKTIFIIPTFNFFI